MKTFWLPKQLLSADTDFTKSKHVSKMYQCYWHLVKRILRILFALKRYPSFWILHSIINSKYFTIIFWKGTWWGHINAIVWSIPITSKSSTYISKTGVFFSRIYRKCYAVIPSERCFLMHFLKKIDCQFQFRKKNNFNKITFISGEIDIPNCDQL